MNLIAILSPFLGTVLKFAIGLAEMKQTGGAVASSQVILIKDIHDRFWNLETFGTFVAALITAPLFFNIYDSTEIGSKLKFGSGWRSALLIGALSGLLTEKVVGAIQALVG